MENQEITEKQINNKFKNTIIIIVSIIIAIACGIGGWFLGKEYANYENKKIEEKENNKENTTNENNNKNEINTEENKNETEKVELSTEELTMLYFKVWSDLKYVEDENLLTDKENRETLTKYLLTYYKKDAVIYDDAVHGDNIGFYYIDEEVYKTYYKEVTGVTYTENELSGRVPRMTYEEIKEYSKDNEIEFIDTKLDKNKIYLQMPITTGYPDILEYKKITKNEKVDNITKTTIEFKDDDTDKIEKLHIEINNNIYSLSLEQ